MREGPHARDKVGRRLAERGMGARRPPGRTRAALPDDRLGHILAALCAAPLNGVVRAVVLSQSCFCESLAVCKSLNF